MDFTLSVKDRDGNEYAEITFTKVEDVYSVRVAVHRADAVGLHQLTIRPDSETNILGLIYMALDALDRENLRGGISTPDMARGFPRDVSAIQAGASPLRDY